ncbi:MAG: FlgD immunoglobulin-like domain containing protein [Candidatus Zixiibacteriota bacterium]
MKYKLLMILGLTALFVSSAAFAQLADPLAGHYTLGNSAEIVSLATANGTIDSASVRVYDYIRSTPTSGHIQAGTRRTYPGMYDRKELRLTSTTAGDYDNDGSDEMVFAYTIETASGSQLVLSMADFTAGTTSWSIVWRDTLCCVSQGYDVHYEYASVRLISANFDDDPEDEFLLAAWGTDGYVYVHIFDADTPGAPVERVSQSTFFVDKLLRDGALFDVAAGDFNSDGIQELIFASGFYKSTLEWQVKARVFTVNINGGSVTQTTERVLYENRPSMYSSGFSSRGFERMAIVTGDFDGDLQDEAAIGWQLKEESWSNIWEWCNGWYVSSLHLFCRYTFFLQPLTVNSNLAAIMPTDSTAGRISYNTGWVQTAVGCAASSYAVPDLAGPSMSLAAGDLNMDGVDELVWTYYDHMRVYKTDPASVTAEKFAFSQIYDYTQRRFLTQANCVSSVLIADVDAEATDSVWIPEVIMMDWGGTSSMMRMQVFGIGVDDSLRFTGTVTVKASITNEFARDGQVAFAAGDFDGDAVRLGPPTHYVKTGMVQPTVILNAPPTHIDEFSGTMYDINSCYMNPCDFYAEYNVQSSQSFEVQTEFHKDWGVSVNASGQYSACGVGVKASFAASYGEGFSKDRSDVKDVIVGFWAQAQQDDAIFASVLDYDVWEYPVYGGGNIQADKALVVRPRMNQATNQWMAYKGESASSLKLNHEVGNILSYMEYDSLEANPDMAEKIASQTGFEVGNGMPGGWSININTFYTAGATVSKDFAMNIGASISGYGVEVGVSGNYGIGAFSTQRVTVGEELGVEVNFPGISTPQSVYKVTPYAYWSRSGAFVLDYAVTPVTEQDGSTFWQQHYGDKCDAAFILPWRFDPELQGIPEDERYKTRDITFYPAKPEPGDTVTIKATVRNFSLRATTGPVSVQFFIGDPDQGGGLIEGIHGETWVSTSGALAPRGYENIEMTWRIPETIGYYPKIYGLVDCHGLLDEVHETNNKGYRVLPVDGDPLDVDDDETGALPTAFELSNNYPNPFNPVTIIEYNLPTRSSVMLEVFNILGQCVKTLESGEKPAGCYHIEWDGTDQNNQPVTTGVYFYRLQADDFAQTKKMILLK